MIARVLTSDFLMSYDVKLCRCPADCAIVIQDDAMLLFKLEFNARMGLTQRALTHILWHVCTTIELFSFLFGAIFVQK